MYKTQPRNQNIFQFDRGIIDGKLETDLDSGNVFFFVCQ